MATHSSERQRDQAQTRAKKLLVYYIQAAWVKAGLKWTIDNELEVRGIVDDLITAGE